jgi:hypothetical protein
MFNLILTAMFKYKTTEEIEAMTPAELDTYKTAQREHEAKIQEQAIAKALEPVLADLKKANEKATDLGLEITELKTKGGQTIVKTAREQLVDFLTENKEKIKAIHKAGSGMIEFKVVGPVTNANGINVAMIPNVVGSQSAPLSPVNLRTVTLLGLTTNLNTNLAAYPYTEVTPKDGDFAFVAEGAIKPQIDFKWETRWATPVKVAGWIKLTEEVVEDVASVESIAYDLLNKKHDLKKAKGIYNGDGIAPNPKGVISYARAFSAGDLALSVVNPNFIDVINAVITDIATTHNYEDETPYMANLVMVHPVDFFINLVSAKDFQGNPLYPTASLFNQVTIGGVTIIPDEIVAVGNILVGDISKYYTTNYSPYHVKVGWVNDDFIHNQFVILGESRFHAFVKKLDEQAFVYDSIATIKTAITKV